MDPTAFHQIGSFGYCSCGVRMRDGVCSWGTPTGRRIYLSHEFYDSPFEDKTSDELLAHVEARIGEQYGTYFKTSKQRDGMTVWLWGGRHPDDIKDFMLY